MLSQKGPRSSLYRLANDHFDGRLPERLAELRAQGESWPAIAFEVHAVTGVRVSHETLRQWSAMLGIGEDPTEEAM